MEKVDWADTKYRPKTFDDVLGNTWAIKKLKRFARTGNFTHLLLAGPAGTGKTTVAEILGRELKAEFKSWNASDDRKLKDIREKIIPNLS